MIWISCCFFDVTWAVYTHSNREKEDELNRNKTGCKKSCFIKTGTCVNCDLCDVLKLKLKQRIVIFAIHIVINNLSSMHALRIHRCEVPRYNDIETYAESWYRRACVLICFVNSTISNTNNVYVCRLAMAQRVRNKGKPFQMSKKVCIFCLLNLEK